MRTRLQQSALIAASCAVAVLLAACGGNDDDKSDGGSSEASSDEPITIGLATAKTGLLKSYDGPADAGAKLAVEDINAQGGVMGRKLKLVSADTQSDKAQGAVATDQVISDGADYVVVSCDFDYGAPSAIAAVEQDKIAMSSCAGSPKFDVAGLGPLAYTMGTSAHSEGEFLGQYAYNIKKWRNAYVLFDTFDQYNKAICDGFRSEFKGLGGKIVGEDTFRNEDPSLAAQVTRYRAANADPAFIFICSSVPGGVTAIRSLRSGGIDTPVLTDDAMDGDYWLDAIPDLSDVYLATYASIFGDDPNDKVNKFVDDFKALTGGPPDTSHAVTGYSVVEALARATEEAGSTDTEAVKKALDSFDDEDLLAGPTTYTPDTHINTARPMVILEIQDGKPRYLETFKPE